MSKNLERPPGHTDGEPGRVLFSLDLLGGRLVSVDDEFAALLGTTSDELISRSLVELVPPNDVVAVASGLRRLRDEGAAVLRHHMRHADGGHVLIRWKARSTGEGTARCTEARDETFMATIERDLVNADQMLGAALEALGAGRWHYDLPADELVFDPASNLLVSGEPAPRIASSAELASFFGDDARHVIRAARAAIENPRLDRFSTACHPVSPKVANTTLRLIGFLSDATSAGQPLQLTGLVWRVAGVPELEAQVLSLLRTDHLTGLRNRRSADQDLRRLLSRAIAGGTPLSVVLLDVDNFKVINDTEGHLAGDEALGNLARVLRREIRPDDAVARWGGEEFLVALRQEAETALLVAERLVNEVRRIGITITAGVAGGVPGPDTTVEDLLARADAALYAGKAAGKDRAVLASGDASTPAGA